MPKGMVIPTVGVKGEFPVVGAPVFGGEAYNQALKPLENASNQWLEWDQEKKRVQDRIDTANIKAYLTIAKGEFEQSIAEEPDYQKYPDMVRSYKDRLTETIGTMSGSEFVKKSVAPFVDLHASQGALYARAYGRTQWIKDEEAKTVTASDMMAKTAVNESYMMGDWTFQTPTPTKEDHSNYVSLQRQSGVLTPGKDRELNDAFDKTVKLGVVDRLIREQPVQAQEILKNEANFPGLTESERNAKLTAARTMQNTISSQAEKDIYSILAQVKLQPGPNGEARIPTIDDIPRDKWNELVATDAHKANQLIDYVNTASRQSEERADREEYRADRREARAERERIKAEETARKTSQAANYRLLAGDREELRTTNLDKMILNDQLSPAQHAHLVKMKKDMETGQDDPVRYAQMKEVYKDLERDFNKNKVFGDPKKPENQEKLNEVTDALQAWTTNPDNKGKPPSEFYKQVMQPYKMKYIGWLLDGTIDPNKRVKELKDAGKIPGPPKQKDFTPPATDTPTNPWNVKQGGATQYLVDNGIATVGRAAKDGGNFLVFANEEDARAGSRKLLMDVYSSLTVDGAMRKWSNNGYGGEIVPAAMRSKKVGSLSENELNVLMEAMKKREGGGSVKPTGPDITAAVDWLKTSKTREEAVQGIKQLASKGWSKADLVRIAKGAKWE